MARLRSGILDNIRGKVGNVIGGVWNGIPYIRAVPSKVHNPNTLKQQTQRLRFKMTVDLISSIAPITQIGFVSGKQGQTPVNRAVSHNIHSLITGVFPDFEYSFENLVISRGNLTPIYDASVDGDTAGTVQFSWENSTGIGNTKPNDSVLLLLFNSDKGVPVYVTEGLSREDEQASVSIPSSFAGDTFHAWIAVTTEAGDQSADSSYLGNFVAAQ